MTGEDFILIDTAVVPLVEILCCRKEEGGRVIDSCLGVGSVGPGEYEVEGATCVLRLSVTADGKTMAPEHLSPLEAPGLSSSGSSERDVGLHQEPCRNTEESLVS